MANFAIIEDFKSKYPPRKLKMLVANDDQFQLLIVRTTLSQLPFISQIDEASNGQMALDLVISSKDTNAYDVILLDLDMPILNGFQACEKIRRFYELLSDNLKLKKSKLRAELQSYETTWVLDLQEAITKMG